MKNAIFEDDFIIFLEFSKIFYKKKANYPPKSPFWHFFYENCDFGGSFDNFSAHFSVKWE